MSFRHQLKSLLSYLKHFATKYERELVYSIGHPATPNQLSQLSAFFNDAVPKELMQFYAEMNGFEVYVATDEPYLPDRFVIRSISDNIIYSSLLRGYFDMNRSGAEDIFTEHRAKRLCDIAFFGDDDELCLIDFEKNSDRCHIVDTAYYDDGFPNTFANAIAPSLESLIFKCFENMTNEGAGDGFRFFWPGHDLERWNREYRLRQL